MFFDFILSWSWKKIIFLPIPTGWRDSNSPMGDGLSTINGFLQNLSLICAVTSNNTGHANKMKKIIFLIKV